MSDHAFDARVQSGEVVDRPEFTVERLKCDDVPDQIRLTLDLAVFTLSADFRADQAETLAKTLLQEAQSIRNPYQEDDDA